MQLTIEAHPATVDGGATTETRAIYEQEGSPHGDSASTLITLATTEEKTLNLAISASAATRSWVVRLHLKPGERVELSDAALLTIDGSVHHIAPPASCNVDATQQQRVASLDPSDSIDDYFPFKGTGVAPPCEAVRHYPFQPSAYSRIQSGLPPLHLACAMNSWNIAGAYCRIPFGCLGRSTPHRGQPV